jgi:DNA repair exonuclease SbcCD ATPase subunit
MVDKNKLSKDIEEQIQSLASDVYIQVEEKLTSLITAAVKAEISNSADQKSNKHSEQENLLSKEIAALKQSLLEKQTDADTAKQSFQVELTQNNINFTETVERLEKELASTKQQSTKQQDEKQSNDNKLEEKLLETEQKLNDKTQEVDGLNGRIMVLTEQEQSLTKQLEQAKSDVDANSVKQAESLNAAKAEVEAAAKQKIDAIAEQLTLAQKQITNVKAEAEQNNTKVTQALQEKVTQSTEQVTKEQESKAELQQQLSSLQKEFDTEKDKNANFDQQEKALQADITKLKEQQAQQTENHQKVIAELNEKSAAAEQKQLDEIKAINAANQEAKQIQETAQQNIIELEKANKALTKQIEVEQSDVQLYQQEVSALKEQVQVAQEGQENILQRFNSNRDKQEQENNKVRETIKFLRDENHELTSASSSQAAEFKEQINELEHKLTEYRLKFEYAQKQLSN